MLLDRLTAKEILRALGDNIVDLDPEVLANLRVAAASKITIATSANVIPEGITLSNPQINPPIPGQATIVHPQSDPLSPSAHKLTLTPELEKIGWTQESIDVHNNNVDLTFANQEKMRKRKPDYNPKNASGAEFAPPDMPPGYGFEVVAVGARNSMGDVCVGLEPTNSEKIPVISQFQCSRNASHGVYQGNNPSVRGCPQCAIVGANSSEAQIDDDEPEDERW